MEPETRDFEVHGGPLDGIKARVTARVCACCNREFLTVGLPLECADAVRISQALHCYVYDDVLCRMTWPGPSAELGTGDGDQP